METEKAIVMLKDFAEGKIEQDKLEHYRGSYKMGCFYTKELQEAIETVLKELEKYKKLYIQALAQRINDSMENNKITNEQLEALNEGWKLENEKLQADLYEANNIISDYIDITKEQDKMIELMTEYIMYKVPFTKETTCLELKEGVRTLNSVKQYFENKAEEAE